jgi:hypothetical protein
MNKLLVLSHSGPPGVGRPVRRGRVTKTDIDVRIVLDFFELVRHVVGEEHEV